MPTYDYECDACGHAFEQWQSFKDEPLTQCPACRKKKLRRLFGGGAAIIFKGSGFYETDYRKESYKQAEKADTEAPAKAGSNGAGTAEANGSTPAAGNGKTGGAPKPEAGEG